MNAALQRAHLLYDQGRYPEAEAFVRQALTESPDDAECQAMLALCLVAQDELLEGEQAAQRAVGFAPTSPFAHYTLAIVHDCAGQTAAAEAAIEEALRLDPDNPAFLGRLAQIQLGAEKTDAALATAERGLAIDPEHRACLGVRARAQILKGDADQAEATLQARLARDPEDPRAHSALGWARLHRGDHTRALESFREALRLDPSLPEARQGLVQALKARYRIYRWFLRYVTWMARLSGQQRWMVLLGAYFGYQVLRSVSRSNPALEPWIKPLLWLYLAFAVFSWIAPSAFDVLLSLNRYGRLSLTDDQRRSARVVGLCLIAAALSPVVGALWSPYPGGPAGLGFLVFSLPVVLTFQHAPGPRLVWGAITLTIGALGLESLVVTTASPWIADPEVREAWVNAADGLALFFVVGVGVVSLLGNLSPAFMEPRLGKLPPTAALAEQGRWRFLAFAATLLAVMVLPRLGGLLVGLPVRPTSFLRIVFVLALVRWCYQGGQVSRGVLVLGAGLNALVAVTLFAGPGPAPVAWLVGLPVGLVSLAFALWLLLAPSMNAYAESARARLRQT